MGNWFTDGASEVGGELGDMWSSATGGETRAQEKARLAQEASGQLSEKQRHDIAQQQQALQIRGNDPASINQHDNWEDWDQARLASQLKPSLQPGTIQKAGEAWKKLGEDIAEIFQDIDAATRQAAGDGMQGKAAEAGLSAGKPLQDWGKSFGDSVRGTGLKIQEAGVAAEQTKSSLQEPDDGNTTRSVLMGAFSPGIGTVADAGLQMKERDEANKQARQVVQTVYAPAYTGVDSSTPTFPPPVDPLNPPPPPDQGRSTPPGSSSNSTGMGKTGGGVPGGGMPSGLDTGGSGGYTPPAQSGSQWANPTPNAPGQGVGMPTPPGAAPPGGGAGFMGGMPPGGGAGGAGRAGGMGGGRGAGGMGAGGKAGAGLGAGGRAGAGMPGGGAAGGAGAAGGRGAGGAGAGAGGGAGQRGQGGEDQEHERPGWLEEQDDIWMDGMPKTAPPVFGE